MDNPTQLNIFFNMSVIFLHEDFILLPRAIVNSFEDVYEEYRDNWGEDILTDGHLRCFLDDPLNTNASVDDYANYALNFCARVLRKTQTFQHNEEFKDYMRYFVDILFHPNSG